MAPGGAFGGIRIGGDRGGRLEGHVGFLGRILLERAASRLADQGIRIGKGLGGRRHDLGQADALDLPEDPHPRNRRHVGAELGREGLGAGGAVGVETRPAGLERDPLERALGPVAFARVLAAHVGHQGIEHLDVEGFELRGRPLGGRLLARQLLREIGDVRFLGQEPRRTAQQHGDRQHSDEVKPHSQVLSFYCVHGHRPETAGAVERSKLLVMRPGGGVKRFLGAPCTRARRPSPTRKRREISSRDKLAAPPHITRRSRVGLGCVGLGGNP